MNAHPFFLGRPGFLGAGLCGGFLAGAFFLAGAGTGAGVGAGAGAGAGAGTAGVSCCKGTGC
ncbi:MAG: hypothetical protein EBW12_07265 [Actinobacteria bacterium]|nr:hypothetical protein [Actinomycetota bacterium]